MKNTLKAIRSIIPLAILLINAACINDHQSGNKEEKSTGTPQIETVFKDTTFVLNGRAIDIRYPSSKINGCILCLPGWNFSRADVCDKSDFCAKAKEAGYILVLPEMGKSIYASSLYPETRSDWTRFPQLGFLTDTLFPLLQKQFGLLKEGGNNFVYGISTGGRGVAMCTWHCAAIFKAGAALSGDYDQLGTPDDNLMKGYYGELGKFTERWKKDDPWLHAGEFKVPLYLAHGGKDKVVPTQQTVSFYQKLLTVEGHPHIELHISDNGEHNYQFWGGETEAVLKFFGSYSK
jgi:S-formylglutathione hydrolase FrmB